jgi:hypothetical protein
MQGFLPIPQGVMMPHEAVNSDAIIDIGVVLTKWPKTGANSSSQILLYVIGR